MLRILLILGVLLATGIFIVSRFILSSQSGEPAFSLPKNLSITNSQTADQVATTSGSLNDRVRELEFSVSELLRNKTSPSASSAPSSSLDSRVKTLETTIKDLDARLVKLEGSTTTTSTTSTGAKIAYIPIGYTGSGNSSSDFANVSGQEVTIDTASYPGYKNMTLEVNFRIFQGNGTGSVRLYNKTDGTAVQSSDMSTTSQDYATKTSSTFGITSGSKTYTLQAKSSTGYAVDIQWSRLRVDF